jgi:hypothetical protein
MIENKQTEESCTIALNNNFLQDWDSVFLFLKSN